VTPSHYTEVRQGPSHADGSLFRRRTNHESAGFVKANAESEAGAMPSTENLAEMGAYNEELVKAGVMLAGEGLHPSSKGVRVYFYGK
jgi:hypothetical protein